MFNTLNPEHILFLDIETVPAVESFDRLPDEWKKLWELKSKSILARDHSVDENTTAETLYDRAGIFAEFGKIICISVGFLKKADGVEQFRLKSFSGDDERQLLHDFAELLNKHFYRPEHRLCAHNGKEFDFPWIARRMVVNGIILPELLNISTKKPWEVQLLDTMEMWKFGDYKSYTSLNLLATLLGVPTPKDDIDGSQVAHVYYNEKNIERIVNYCQKDVLTVFHVLRKYRNEKLIAGENVVVM